LVQKYQNSLKPLFCGDLRFNILSVPVQGRNVGYNVGKPWNCQQASDDLAKEQAWAEEVMKSGNISAYMGALSNVSKAESNQVRLCKK
jgi:hypothetical protein